MNLEDGAVLGALYTHLRNPSQISLLSQTYEDLRTERCKNAFKLDISLLQLGSLKDGPEQEERDRMLIEAHASIERFGEPARPFPIMWNQQVDIWKYDAWEDVADWWLRLGSLSSGLTEGYKAPVSIRRLSVGVEKQVQIASES
jgi:salicylate hydroxylase